MDAPTTEELTPELVGEFIRKESSRRQDGLRQSILAASETNPDQYAEATRLGRTAKVPPEFVASDMDTYKNGMKIDDQTAGKIVSLYPDYEAWLTEPDNAKLAHDDVYSLTSVMDTIRAFPGGAVQSIGQGVQGLGNLSLSTSQVLRDMSQKNPYMMMDRNSQMLQVYTTLFGLTAPTVGGGIRDAGEFISPPEERQNTATNISSGLGQVAGQILTYYVTGGAGAVTLMAGQGAQQQTERLDAAGVTDPTTRLASQALGAGATALTERIELGVLLKGVPGLDKVMGQLPKALQNKWASRVIDVTAAGGAEAAQETIEGFLQDTIEYAAYNPDVKFLDGMMQQAGEAGAVGVIARALILGIGGGRTGNAAVNEQAAREAQAQATATGKAQILETKLNSRDPEKMREVLKAGNPEGKTITLDGTVVQQFYQSGIDPEEFFNLAPTAREQFGQADTAGTDITIPLDEFLHAMSSAPDNAYDFMTDFMKVDPDIDPALQGWDLDNPDELNAFVQQAIRQAQEEWGARFEQAQELTIDERIERQIRDNLMNRELMGEKARAPEAATTEASLYGAFARTLLKTGDEAAARVFERRFGTNFQVEGYRPPLPRRVGTGNAYYDKLRSKVKARAAAEKRGDKKRTEQRSFFGVSKKTRTKATPTPLINALVRRGGIARGAPITGDLEAIGITPKSHPRLFRKDSGNFNSQRPMGDIDGIPVDELEGELGTSGVFSRDEDLNGYVSTNELLEKLRDETFGDYIRSDAQAEQEAIEEGEQQILDLLDQEGIDITTATAEEIDAAIDNATTRYREEYETMQPGSFYQSAREDITETESFKEWFGNSKVVDANGKPLVVYHGTPDKRDIESSGFAPSVSRGSVYFFTDNKRVADTYADDRRAWDYQNAEPDTLPVYLSIQNPMIIDAKGKKWRETEKHIKEAKEAGHDGVIIKNSRDEYNNTGNGGALSTVYAAFKPTQIKSVNNTGTWDANDSRIYYQNQRGVTQFTDRGQTIVRLFQGADESTLLHETGHVFLDIFADIASQPDAPQAIKDDWQKTLEWLGVQSAADIKVDQHEQFARGFEAYLYKGEAPSAALRGTFDRFKIWLANIYRSIKQLRVNVSPEMSAVFDRLLATNDEIDAIRNNPVVGIEAATLEMLSPAQQERYLKAKAEAIRNAKDKLFRKAIRQARRKNTEWWNEEASRVQAEVEAELMAQPVYRAIDFVQNGQKLDETLVIKAFDDASPGKPLGKEELKYLPRGTRTKEGGADPKIVADMFGFKSAVDMLQAMQKAQPYKAAVQKQTEDRMIAAHGDMLNDGTIEAEALAMVMQEDTKAAQVELKALSELAGTAYPSDGDFARAAEIAIGTLTVDQAVKPEKYYRAALRAAREYGKALQAKQYEDRVVKTKDGTSVVKGAASWKRQEILNKHLHRLSKAAREETESAIDKFKKLEKVPPKGDAKKVKIDPAYHQKIWDILDKYNLAPRLSDAKRLKLELSAINAWIKEQETDEDASLMMPPELLAADNKQHYRDLTLNEFRGLRDLVTNLETQGRNKRKYIIEGQQRDLENLVAEMVQTAEQNNAPRDVALSTRREDRKLGKRFGRIVNGIDAVNTKASQMMVLMDGGNNYGIWTQSIYEPVQRAEIAKNVRNRAEYKKFRELMQKHFGDEPADFLDREIQAGAEPIRFEEMLSIALHQGTEDNRQKLIDGYEKTRGWDEDFIDRILTNMREKDWLFVQDVWDYLDSFWPETSAVEARRFGYAPEKIEALPFEVTTIDGKQLSLKGGYMRIMYDADQDVMAGNDELSQTFKEMQIGKNARAATRRGSQIERVSGVRRPFRLDLDVLTEHIGEQVGIITMAETVENVNKVLRKKEIQETAQAILGRDGKEMLDLWLKDVAVGGALSGGTINKSLRSIRANYTVGRLGLRPITALLQFSGLSHTVADLGAKQTAKGLAKMFSRGNPYTLAKEVAEKSVFMQERRFTLNRDLADALGAYTSRADSTRQKIAALMLYPMQKTQELVDTATWLAAYDKAIADDMGDADAIRAADIAVARLQASGLTSDLAAIERGTLNTATQRQELVKASTMFFSYFNAKYNLLKNKNIQFRNKEISGVDLAMSYVMALLVEGAISSLIMGQIDWDDDDDEELSAWEIGKGVTLMTLNNAASTVPFVRTISGGAQGFDGAGAAETQLAGLGEFAGRLAGTGEKLLSGDTEKINGYALTRQAVDALNVFVPLPASTINQFVRGLERQDKTGEATAMDYLIYREDRF